MGKQEGLLAQELTERKDGREKGVWDAHEDQEVL
jgi:hypothetical protein